MVVSFSTINVEMSLIISQITLKTNFGMNNWPIFAPKASKGILWMKLRHFLEFISKCSFDPLKIRLSHSVLTAMLWSTEVGFIILARPVCSSQLGNSSTRKIILEMVWKKDIDKTIFADQTLSNWEIIFASWGFAKWQKLVILRNFDFVQYHSLIWIKPTLKCNGNYQKNWKTIWK